MTKPRCEIVRLESTRTYHCFSRCVRQAFLCGTDFKTGKSYEHRKKWIEDLLCQLSSSFCIDVVSYAVMSNHYHTVLYVNDKKAESLSDREVLVRRSKFSIVSDEMWDFVEGRNVPDPRIGECKKLLQKWRKSLMSMSRFLGLLNQTVAVRANREDGCKGRFWERRFESQPILDEESLLKAMVYVDLNPVRAGVVSLPEDSQFTSLVRRIKEKKSFLVPFSCPVKKDTIEETILKKKKLEDIESSAEVKQMPEFELPITFDEYLELCDWTGRRVVAGKRGAIPQEAPSILKRLGYCSNKWLEHTSTNKFWLNRVLGSRLDVRAFAKKIGQQWFWYRDGPLPYEAVPDTS